MRNPKGYAVWFDPELPGPKERDTLTCFHCNGVVVVKPFQDPSEIGGFCRLCMKHICTKCVDKAVCLPFEKKIEIYEKEQAHKSSFHRAVGTVLD